MKSSEYLDVLKALEARRKQQILSVVDADSGGVTIKAIADAIGLSAGQTTAWMRRLRDDGLVACVFIEPNHAVWVRAERAENMRATVAEQRRQRFLSVLDKHHTRGISLSEIAAAVGMSDQRASHCLRVLREEGLAASTREGRMSVWARPQRARELEAIRKDAARKRAKRAVAAQRALDAWSHGSVRRIVSAKGAPPLNVRAPISVFHLGV